jgi:Tfp pilus assembly protein PilF
LKTALAIAACAAVLLAGCASGPAGLFKSSQGSATLKAGLRQFDDGNYADSSRNLQGAIKQGLTPREAADAHKHLAFIHCASNRERQCRGEFRNALALDPTLDLEPAEAGHPVWGPIFRSVKTGR